MFNKKIVIAPALFAASALVLAGCASDAADTDAASVTPEVTTTENVDANATTETETPAVEPVAELIEVTYENAWVRWSEMSEQVGGMTGAYVELTNNGSEPITLLGAITDRAVDVEIHEMVMIDGEMKMQKLPGGIKIQPGATSVFKPGDNHLMIVGITEPILAGDVLSLELIFAEDNVAPVVLENLVAKPVEAGGESYDEGGMDMDMDMDMDMGSEG